MTARKYSVIVFDLGNVLIHFTYDPTIRKLNVIEPGLGDRFSQFYKANYEFHRNHERGKITSEVFLERILSELENKVGEEAFCKFFSDIFTLNEDVISLLPRLKEKYMLVLLSNTNLIHLEYGWKGFEFTRYFDKMILSHEVQAVKPEPEIYKAVELYTGKPASEHIFIDDIKEYADVAKSLGWDAIHFINYDQLIKELTQREIL